MNKTEIVSLSINVILMLLGLSGNAIIIAVYGRKKAKKSTDTLILSQAILDFTGGIIAPIDIIRTLADPVKSDALCKFTIFMLRIVAYSALYLTSAIAVDRCILVKRPFDRRTSPKTAFVGVVISVMFAGISQSYNFIYIDLADFGVCVRNGMPAAIEISVSILTTASFAVTLVLAVVCYGLIYASIRSQARVRAAMLELPQSTAGNSASVCENATNSDSTHHQSTCNGHDNVFIAAKHKDNLEASISNKDRIAHPVPQGNDEVFTISSGGPNLGATTPKENPHQSPKKERLVKPRRDHKTTKMLLFTTIIILLLWLPSTVLNHIPGDVLIRFRRQSAGKNALIYSCFAMRSINHVVNIFIYLAVNTRFRGECKQLFKTVR
ncbi:oxytocin receptor-like [Lytechinus variegatus]|uniref:oxytocin receptor-like n=1 Tax=Lytechinus variegatus TaxID=7654 RepID=UPI001BB1DEBE|nr:oxytocin receptor-like [Lytechinus variegatus]